MPIFICDPSGSRTINLLLKAFPIWKGGSASTRRMARFHYPLQLFGQLLGDISPSLEIPSFRKRISIDFGTLIRPLSLHLYSVTELLLSAGPCWWSVLGHAKLGSSNPARRSFCSMLISSVHTGPEDSTEYSYRKQTLGLDTTKTSFAKTVWNLTRKS
jgi:hypothetical protein